MLGWPRGQSVNFKEVWALRAVNKTWHLLPHDAAAIDRLARSLATSPIVGQLLLNRKQCDTSTAARFLRAP